MAEERGQDASIVGGASGNYAEVDSDNRQLVRTENASSGSYGTTSVSTTATQLFASDSSRISLQFQNLGSKRIYWGFDSSVTTSNGTEMQKGDIQTIEGYTGTIYAIVGSSTADVRTNEY